MLCRMKGEEDGEGEGPVLVGGEGRGLKGVLSRDVFYCSLCQNLFVFLFVYFSCIFYSLLCTFFCFGCC